MAQNASHRLLIVGIYPLLLAIMTGAAWLDGVYARALRAGSPAGSLQDVFAQVSDALLLPAALTVLAGIAATILAAGRARWLCLASLGVLGMEFLLPALASAIPGAIAALDGNGMLLRLALLLGALACAFFSLREVAK